MITRVVFVVSDRYGDLEVCVRSRRFYGFLRKLSGIYDRTMFAKFERVEEIPDLICDERSHICICII